MARRCREPGSCFQRPDTPKVFQLWRLAGWPVGPCSNRYLAFCLRLDWPARSATRSMFGDFLANHPGLFRAVNALSLNLSSWAGLLPLVFPFSIYFLTADCAESGPLVLEGPPSGYLIPEARLAMFSVLTVSLPRSCGLSRACCGFKSRPWSLFPQYLQAGITRFFSFVVLNLFFSARTEP